MEVRPVACCGVREIAYISHHKDAKDAMARFIELIGIGDPNKAQSHRFRFAFFTEARGGGYGEKFATFIAKHKLGNLIETEGNHINPNSNNELKVWVWTLDHGALLAYKEAQGGRVELTTPTVEPIANLPAQPPPYQTPAEVLRSRIVSRSRPRLSLQRDANGRFTGYVDFLRRTENGTGSASTQR